MDIVRFLRSCFTNCFTCKEDTINQEPNERTQLLVNPVNPIPRRRNSDESLPNYPNSLPKRDDQNALTKIILDNAQNVIDVSAMDTHNLQPHELNDRIKLYRHKLEQQWSNVQDASNVPSGLLKDIKNPEMLLAAPGISAADLKMMRNLTLESSVAISNIQVEHKEDLVVTFAFKMPS